MAPRNAILDKLGELELSALKGMNALSLGGVDEQGMRKLLARLAEDFSALAEMITSPAEPVVMYTANSPAREVDITAPVRIWLQVDTRNINNDGGSPFPSSHDGVTWSSLSVGGLEVPYVRADLAHEPLRPMTSAPKDGTPVLLKFKSARELPERLEAMGDRWFVGSNQNDASEWVFAAPVGYGGISAARLAGWMPVPDNE